MTEQDVQNALWYDTVFRGNTHLCPNVYVYRWESDFISVTRAGYVHEYEVKLTKADFRADAKKREKHQALVNGWREPSEWEQRYINRGKYAGRLTEEGKPKTCRPNYFWYVCPEGLIATEDVPAHAGLIYIEKEPRKYPVHGGAVPYLICAWPKQAPRLHREKISERQGGKVTQSFAFKYWKLRMSTKV